MSAHAGNTGTTNIGQDIMKTAIKMANDRKQMTGITVSMEAMFFMETKEEDEVNERKCATISARLLEAFMPDKKVEVLTEHHADNFVADMLTAPQHKSDLFLCTNDLDNESFGDVDDFSNYRHFFSLISRPTVAADLPSIMMGVMDRLTSRPFGTSEATAMRIRVGHNELRSISQLALAINTPDKSWLSRLNRTNGKRMESEPWAERTLKERLIVNVLSSGVDLNADRTPAEWANIFETFCDFDKAEDECLATGLDVGRTFVSFNHIAGEGYEIDFGTNLELVTDMCKVVDNSIVLDHDQYWSTPSNAKRIASLIEEISEIKAKADKVKLSKTYGKIPSYHIMIDGESVGKVSSFSNLQSEPDAMSNSVLTIGNLSVWVNKEVKLPYEVAILLKRARS